MKGWSSVMDRSSIACGCCVVMVSSYAAALKGEEDMERGGGMKTSELGLQE
jgi:hypothetical protein